MVRRGCEILKSFSITGIVDLPRCAKWTTINNPLHRKPTDEELINPNSVVALIRDAEQKLRDLNLTEKTLANYRYDGFDLILRRHFELGLTDFSPEVTADIVKNICNAYKIGAVRKSIYNCVRKTAYILIAIHRGDEYQHRKIPKYGLRKLSKEYEVLLENFCVYEHRTGELKDSSLKTIRSAVQGFLFELEDVGITSFSDISRRVISERATHFAERFFGGLSRMIYSIRLFLLYLHLCGATNEDLSTSVPQFVAPRRPIREGFSPEVINKLLSAADTASSVGKRDYAIMMLAKQTGLRACDICKLKRENIDWRENEIRLVQSKTGSVLSLPLPVESGNAIADYLLNGRPKCDFPYIFISNDNPHRQLVSMNNIIKRYIKRAGVAYSIPPKSGFHSFRRAYGKTLLESETSIDMLGELLGHLDMDSAKPYIAIDEQGLKRCALNLVGKVGDIS